MIYNNLNGRVFPTGVGMNRAVGAMAMKAGGVPHRRGDEPARFMALMT